MTPIGRYRRRQKHDTKKRTGFTLIELLVVIGVIGILASMVLIAINPARQLGATNDVKRTSTATELQNALYQYLIDHGQYPTTLPEGTGAALPVCRYGVAAGSSSCISLDAIVPTYFVAIPVDESETDANITGFSVYTNVGRPVVIADHLGE